MLELLAGCATTPMGPTVQVMPGRSKSFDAFQTDQLVCKNFAEQQVQGQAEAANQRAVGGAVLTTVLGAGLGAATGAAFGNAGAGAAIGAAAGAGGGSLYGANASSGAQLTIQQQYDNAFAQCMYSKGNQAAGLEAARVLKRTPPPAIADLIGRTGLAGWPSGAVCRHRAGVDVDWQKCPRQCCASERLTVPG